MDNKGSVARAPLVLVLALLGLLAAGALRWADASAGAQPTGAAPGADRRLDEAPALVLAPGVEVALVRVPAGEFTMGSSGIPAGQADERPRHEVYLDEFCIGQYELTVAQFRAFVEAKGYQTTAERKGWAYAWTGQRWETVEGATWQHPRGPGSDAIGLDDHPVTQVSWVDAYAFCDWASKTTGLQVHLPSEAQWEKAARGGDARLYPWGEEELAGDRLNYADRNSSVRWADEQVDDGYAYTAPVGSYPAGASPYGAKDMAGNVWEWVADRYGKGYYGWSPRENPTGPWLGFGRVVRGGGWPGYAWMMRTTNRTSYPPAQRSSSLGFRVVVTAE